MRCVVLFSGGRGSNRSLHLMAARGCSICCLVSFSNGSVNGLFPCLDESLVEKQAESLRLPLRVFRLSGKKQAELLELQEAFSQLERDYGIRGMVIGDSVPRPRFSQLDALCRVLGIQLLAPLLEERKETIALNESSAVGAVSDEPVPCSSVQSSGSGSAREAVARKAVA